MKRATLETMQAAMKAASDDVTRHRICGVLLESDGKKATITATDGHMLFSRELEDDIPAGEYFLHRDNALALKVLIKAIGRIDGCGQETTERGIRLRFPGAIMDLETTKAQQITYPDWRQILPKEDKPRLMLSFNADFLATLAELVNMDMAKKRDARHRVTLAFSEDAMGPIRVYGDDGITSGCTAVFMPCRLGAQFEEERGRAVDAIKAEGANNG